MRMTSLIRADAANEKTDFCRMFGLGLCWYADKEQFSVLAWCDAFTRQTF